LTIWSNDGIGGGVGFGLLIIKCYIIFYIIII
jgi:hypothetical protein